MNPSHHIHRFSRVTLNGWFAVTRWHCRCGLKVDTDLARRLEGTDA